MAKQKETIFKERVLKDLRKLPFSYWTKIQQVAIRGTPDILGSLCGIFVAIELKSENGKLDALQEHILELIADTGGVAVVSRPQDWDACYAKLVEIGRKNAPAAGSYDSGNRGDNHCGWKLRQRKPWG